MKKTIRGATTVEKNDEESILLNTELLLKEIIIKNKLSINDIESIIFSTTKDLDSVYPAKAARNIGIVDASLMCLQEMVVKDSLDLCIRVLIWIKEDKQDIKNIYLKKAKILRPDLI